MRKYFLITNVSGMRYWSYLGTVHNTTGILADAVAKHGDIYINRNNGYMTKDCVKTIHQTVERCSFPPEA